MRILDSAFVLFILSLILLAYSYSAEGWAQGLLLNLGSGLLGSVVVILLVDMIVEKNKAAELRERQAVILSKLYYPILHQFGFLFELYWGASPDAKNKGLYLTEDFFDDSYIKAIEHLNLYNGAPLGSEPAIDWFYFIRHHATVFRNSVRPILNYNGYDLDSKTKKILLDIYYSTFLEMGCTIPLERPPGSGLMIPLIPTLREYLPLFIELTKQYYTYCDAERIKYTGPVVNSRYFPAGYAKY